MEQAALKQVQYGGMTTQAPEIWDVETEEHQEFDGQISYSIAITAPGNDVRSIDLSFGPLPVGSDAYSEACGTYEEVIGEEGLQASSADQHTGGMEQETGESPILCFDFKGMKAFGFSLITEDGQPCFFFCLDIPQPGQTDQAQADQSKLLTVLLRAAGNEDLQTLLDFVEEHLSCR